MTRLLLPPCRGVHECRKAELSCFDRSALCAQVLCSAQQLGRWLNEGFAREPHGGGWRDRQTPGGEIAADSGRCETLGQDFGCRRTPPTKKVSPRWVFIDASAFASRLRMSTLLRSPAESSNSRRQAAHPLLTPAGGGGRRHHDGGGRPRGRGARLLAPGTPSARCLATEASASREAQA